MNSTMRIIFSALLFLVTTVFGCSHKSYLSERACIESTGGPCYKQCAKYVGDVRDLQVVGELECVSWIWFPESKK